MPETVLLLHARLFLLMVRLPPCSTLFPYTTLFRSGPGHRYSSNSIDIGVTHERPVLHCRTGRSRVDRKSTRLNSSHPSISYAVFCLKKKNSSGWTWIRAIGNRSSNLRTCLDRMSVD